MFPASVIFSDSAFAVAAFAEFFGVLALLLFVARGSRFARGGAAVAFSFQSCAGLSCCFCEVCLFLGMPPALLALLGPFFSVVLFTAWFDWLRCRVLRGPDLLEVRLHENV